MNNSGIVAPASSWTTESLRFTAIYRDATAVSMESIFEPVTGREPEKQGATPRKLFWETGIWEGHKLDIVSAETRLDWSYSEPQPLPSAQDPSIPQTLTPPMMPAFMQDFPKELRAFSTVVEKWLTITTRPMHRVALGVSLIQPISDRPSGYNLLNKYLSGMNLDGEQSRDFMYQINRPRNIAVGGQQITANRLMTWNSLIFRAVRMDISDVATVIAHGSEEPGQVIRVQMDLNTAAELEGRIDPLSASKIFDIFKDYAIEISEKGDVS